MTSLLLTLFNKNIQFIIKHFLLQMLVYRFIIAVKDNFQLSINLRTAHSESLTWPLYLFTAYTVFNIEKD